MWWGMKWFTEKLTRRHNFLSLYLMPSLSHFSISPKPFFLSTSFFILFKNFWFYGPSLFAFHSSLWHFQSSCIIVSSHVSPVSLYWFPFFLTSLFSSHLPHIFSYSSLQISHILSHFSLHLPLSWFILLCIGNLLSKCLLVNIFLFTFFLVFLLFFPSRSFLPPPISFLFLLSSSFVLSIFPPLPLPFLLQIFPFIPIRFFLPLHRFFLLTIFPLLLLLFFLLSIFPPPRSFPSSFSFFILVHFFHFIVLF